MKKRIVYFGFLGMILVQGVGVQAQTQPTGSSISREETTNSVDATTFKSSSRFVASTAIKTYEMYRLYNPNSGEHFYTASDYEAKQLIQSGWGYEGVGWNAPEKGSPVYRLYNPNAGDHHYTMLLAEKNMLTANGWNYEGIGWYSDDLQAVPLYRAYNPNAKSGSHNYTKDGNEQKSLVNAGWQNEGIAWYGSDVAPDDSKSDSMSQTYGPNQWYVRDGQKLHTDQNSQIQKGFQWISGQIYYFDDSGNLQVNKSVTDRGNTYQLNSDGTLTSGNASIEKAISAGMTKVGNSPYVLGGGRTSASIAANQFDCSSFVYWMYQQAGISLGNQSATTTWTQQYVGSATSFATMKRGDIFMMSNTSHVGLYLGGGYFIQSSPNAKFSTVYGGQAQPNMTYTSYTDTYGAFYGGVGVSRLSDILSKDPADGNDPVTRMSWEQLQNNIVRRIVR